MEKYETPVMEAEELDEDIVTGSDATGRVPSDDVLR